MRGRDAVGCRVLEARKPSSPEVGDEPLDGTKSGLWLARVERAEGGVEDRHDPARIAPQAATRLAKWRRAEQIAGAPREHAPDAIARHVGNQHDDRATGGESLLGRALRVGEHVAQGAQGVQLLRGVAKDGEAGHLREHRRGHLEHVDDEFRVQPVAMEQHRPEEVERPLHGIEDRGARTLADVDEAEAFERLERLADGRAVDAELGGEFAFGRELLPWREATVEDGVAQEGGDLVVDAVALDTPERLPCHWLTCLAGGPSNCQLPSRRPRLCANGPPAGRLLRMSRSDRFRPMSTVRTRFAPSPSGYLHIGGARTALFNYLFARHHGGRFVLRVEDTDRERSTQQSIDAIVDALRWLELEWDEGPYFQSARLALHREQVEGMLQRDAAYRCYCPAEQLDAKRQAARADGRTPVYDRTCRTLRSAPGDRPFTVRFKAPVDGTTVVPDLIKGHVRFQNDALDDIILLRSDGTPTYNLSAVVDDALMAITHIIRGEDHLSNTPKQIQLYQALNFPLPRFAHVPLILGPDRARLSKRHGATSVTAYRDMGYLPAGVVNYLARLGWSYGDQEVFTRAELIEKFTLGNVGTAAGVYNPEKAEWCNAAHLRALPPAELARVTRPYIEAAGFAVPPDDALETLVTLLRERASTLVELVESGRFFLAPDLAIDEAAVAKHLQPGIYEPLRELAERLTTLEEWTEEALHIIFRDVTEKFAIKLGKLAQPVRVAVTGTDKSPGIFEVLALLGRERSTARLEAALERLRAGVTSGGANF